MDNNLAKVKNNESGTITAQIDVAEVTSIHLDPVPQYAPGVLVMKPAEAEEEHIFFRTRDAVAGTVSGLTRDITSLNGGAGRLHINTSPWESMQAAEYVNYIVEVLQRGWQAEMQTPTYANTTSFTVVGNQTSRYTKGRLLRYAENDAKIGVTVSSSYNAGTGLTTVVVQGFAVPTPIVSVEFLTSQAKGFTGAMPVFYGEDAEASDTYAITVLPSIGAYYTGMIVIFKANTANTGAATLNVNTIGAAAIKKQKDQALETGDILAGQTVTLVYDGTNFQMISTLPSVKATGAEIDEGTNDAKFLTPKAVNDSHNIPMVAPGTSGNVLTSDGTDWTSASAGGLTKAAGSDIIAGTDDTKYLTPKTIKDAGLPYLTTAKARGHANSAQTVANKTRTVIVLDDEDYDPGSNFNVSTHRFVAPVNGYYLITGHVPWGGSTTVGIRFAQIDVDGTNITTNGVPVALADVGANGSVAVIAYLTASQYVELSTYQTTGGNLDTAAGASMEVHLLSV